MAKKESFTLAKAGFEVEGCLRGKEVLTLFVDAEEFLHSTHSIYDNEFEIFKQIYISDPNCIFDVGARSHLWSALLGKLLEAFEIVTVCAPKFCCQAVDGVNLVLSVKSDGIEFLRTGESDDLDEIKFDLPNGGCLVFNAADGIYTAPEDFNADLKIELF
jgi:hypothetical protein